jgi:hypothetical protein
MSGGLHTWSGRHRFHEVWTRTLSVHALACGCLVDTYNGQIWEPCMAHEADGHLAVIIETDGMHVARCLVLRCGWQETHIREIDTVRAAQAHWRGTREQKAGAGSGSS